MGLLSKEILSMMYASTSEYHKDGVQVFWCREYENSKDFVLLFCRDSDDECITYKNVVKYFTYNNIGVVLFDESVILVDLTTPKEYKQYNNIIDIYVIYNEALVLRYSDKLIVYSLRLNKEILNSECNPNFSCSYKTLGTIYDFMSFGLTGLFIRKDGTDCKLIQQDEGCYAGDSNKTCYNDIIVYNTDLYDTYNRKDIKYFVCGADIYTKDEFLEFLTIESIEESYKTCEVVAVTFENGEAVEHTEETKILKGYNVITTKGYKGTLTPSFRTFKLNKFKHIGNLFKLNFKEFRRLNLE